MNSITDNMISLEEARYALQCMNKYSFTAEEALETIDEYVNRVRNVNMAWLANYIIDTKLSEMQRQVIRRCCFDSISVAECAGELGVSLRAVYSARTKAMDIIGEYLEALVMYFRNLPENETVPLFVGQSLKILSAGGKEDSRVGNIIRNIRLSHGVSTQAAAKAVGRSEKDILSFEKGTKSLTLEDLEKYSRAFGVTITVEFDKGNGVIKWNEQ